MAHRQYCTHDVQSQLTNSANAMLAAKRSSCLEQVHWRRIVLDEMQEVRSSTRGWRKLVATSDQTFAGWSVERLCSLG